MTNDPNDPVDTDRTASMLAHKRAELEDELARLTEPPSDQGTIGFGKRVGEGTSQAVERLSAVSAHGNLLQLLAEVQRAQAKLEEGNYGRCDVCCNDIVAGRLEARPWATTCVSCAAQR